MAPTRPALTFAQAVSLFDEMMGRGVDYPQTSGVGRDAVGLS